MTDPFASYIKQVDRALDLPRRQKKELLCGFQAELKERFSDIPNEKTLLADIGRPEEVAYTLLEAVDVKEHTRFNSIRIRWLCSIIAVLALLATLSIGSFAYFGLTRIDRAEVTIVEDPIPTQYSFPTDGGE